LDERFNKERVPNVDSVALRLCRALKTLKDVRDTEADDETITVDSETVGSAISELTDALFDLCGAPQNSPTFARDYLWDVVDEAMPSEPSDEKFRDLIGRVRQSVVNQ
jgi:hypothetical protein